MATEMLSKCHNAAVTEIIPKPQGGHQFECNVCGNPCELQESMSETNEEKKVDGAEEAQESQPEKVAEEKSEDQNDA